MSSHMINLFLCILSSLYLCFGLLYFCCRILPSKHKISLPLFLCLSVFMALLFWIKRESQHNGITIVFQLTTFLVTLFLFQASFMKKLAVYFIFQQSIPATETRRSVALMLTRSWLILPLTMTVRLKTVTLLTFRLATTLIILFIRPVGCLLPIILLVR